MRLLDEPIPGLKVFEAVRKDDQRGFFVELFKASLFSNLNIPNNFVQLNESQSIGSVRRGMHFQWDPPMAKVARISRGSARLVALDLRIDSPNYGNSHFIDLTEDDSIWYYSEFGFARGFETSGGLTNLEYLVTREYNSQGEGGISTFDTSLSHCWKTVSPIVSQRDLNLPTIQQWATLPQSKHLKMEFYT
jgi:dTDP-4-dehydrorhamnose 3,5-epimerase